MPCGTTDGHGNPTHYCEYPYLRNGPPSSDPYSIHKEKLGGIASDDPVERRRAELIRALCHWCTFFKADAKKRYEEGVLYPQLYSQLLREISMIMSTFMNEINELPETILFEYDVIQYSKIFVKFIKENLYRFMKFNYPTLQNPYFNILATIAGGKSRRNLKSPKRRKSLRRR